MEVYMEKISRIVPGNARVSAVDTKSAAPARPGMPSFGRPVGESTSGVPDHSSTASRAAALHKSMIEAKKAVSQERVISRMADEFFMSRIRRPEEELAAAPPIEAPAEFTETAPTDGPPEGYTPRGSFVDVRV